MSMYKLSKFVHPKAKCCLRSPTYSRDRYQVH
ncbi:hypothetical protein Pint_18584 [Pistacia integerrima]|uniref:Uncharacterized protein n=2 Tax=Pistacia TaxID=55512 RepID=A0ACC1BNC6_9ROSI|nr:hypothetical protein Pint_18584 [Pistacia integerrima]KAJ0100415.1 hypothetical protein Patl1_21255 [Pistacia atlantica]